MDKAKIGAKLKELIDAAERRRDARIQAKQEKVNAWFGRTSLQNYWGEFARIMDERLQEDRANRGKSGPSKRGFSDVEMTKAVEYTTYPGLRVFFNTVLRDELNTGTAAYVGVKSPARQTGHAIAIYRQDTGRFFMFDPNFGSYELSEAKLRESFVYIFKTAYPNMKTGTSDKGDYEDENGNVDGRYMIFKGNRPPMPIVALPQDARPTPTPRPPVLAPMTTPQVFQPAPSNVSTRTVTGTPINRGTTTRTGTQPRTGGTQQPPPPSNPRGAGIASRLAFFEQNK